MELAPALLLIVATVLMLITVALSLIPIMPGPLLTWVVALAYGLLSGWERFTPAAAWFSTAIMLIAMTNDFWLPLFGVKGGGMSGQAALGSFVGGVIGTFAIPIPLIGSLIGAVAGAALVEFWRQRTTASAVQAGKVSLQLFVVGNLIKIGACVAIFIVYAVSLVATG